jgi:hypothetical protein
MSTSWNKQRPCVTCGATSGNQIRCTNCGTLGCQKCVGQVGYSQCKVCRKNVEKKYI